MNMDLKRLWAKSCPKDMQLHPSMFLLGHLKDVYAAAEKVLAGTGDEQLRALGLKPEEYRERLDKCVLVAAAIHDLGKANDHFQGMICRTRNVQQNPQGIRHEWVTILILKELREWLRPAVESDVDFAIVEWAVSGHHPSHSHASPPRTCPPGSGCEIKISIDHADFTACLRWLAQQFSIAQPIPKLTKGNWPLVNSGNVFGDIVTWSKAARKLWDEKVQKSNDRQLVAAVKNCLIAADIAGSALPKDAPFDSERWDRITLAFSDVPEPGDLKQIVEKRLGQDKPRPFQASVASSTDLVTFVKAGCGSGKTLAAYMWAAKNHPTRRLYFCYPTTGTATEGFKDYLFEPEGELGNLGAKLFHSRSRIDHEIIFGNDKDSASPEADAAIKAESLDAWSTPIVACTVDTVLGIVQNNKRGLFAWPALAQSAFVFDEIHAYDDRLFGALLRFLRDLPGLPVLLMTASLPMPREEALTDVLKEFRKIDMKPIAGPKELEELPRYHKVIVEDGNPLPMIEKTLKEGGKVLWVCNTVKRVMDAADVAKHLSPMIYHSRFKYVDRVQRHKTVIDAFNGKGAALAICSQVAEMSLDLSADLLVTDLATVPALIQRMGRLNRRAKVGDPTKPFIVIEPENNLPYSTTDLEAAKVWFAKLADKDISQKQLAEAWEQSAENPPDLVPSAWLDGGPMTTVTELRETSPGITVLMRSDVNRGEVGKYTLPMPPPPKAFDWRSWPKHKCIPIVEDHIIEYEKLRGAKWKK